MAGKGVVKKEVIENVVRLGEIKKGKAVSVLTLAAAPSPSVVPVVPKGFVAPGAAAMKRFKKPTDPQRALAIDLGTELREAASYLEDLGKRAPDPEVLADDLDLAAGWDAVYAVGQKFVSYALSMRAMAWDNTLGPMKKLTEAFTYATRDDSEIAERYPHLTAFLGVREAQAKRGAVTRQKNQKKAKKTSTTPAG